jgi:hypothetical protein
MSAIAASFNDKSETKAVIANGVKINGEKYMTIEASDESLKAKKVRHHCHSEQGSVFRNTDSTRVSKALSSTRPHRHSSSPTTQTASKHPTPSTRSPSLAIT